MIYPSVNMLTGQPEKDYTKKPTENEFDKQCLEKIPPQDLREICDRAFLITKAAFGALRNLTFTYCSECEKSYPKKHLQKVPCFVSVLEMTALCSNHYMQKLENELCQKYLDEHKPKLDLTDFARV